MLHKVTKIRDIKPFNLILDFDDNKSKTVNIKNFIEKKFNGKISKDSPYKIILNEKYFGSVKLRKEDGAIFWDNGIDFCPQTLREIGKDI